MSDEICKTEKKLFFKKFGGFLSNLANLKTHNLLTSKFETMKKILLLGSLGLIVLASCKKDYTCTCKWNGLSYSTSTINDTKKNAESKCNEGDVNVTISGVTAATDCSI